MNKTIQNIVEKYVDDPQIIEMIVDELQDELMSKYQIQPKNDHYYWEHGTMPNNLDTKRGFDITVDNDNNTDDN